MQQQKREIEEEQAYIKLLQTILHSQIKKVIQRRKQYSEQPEDEGVLDEQ